MRGLDLSTFNKITDYAALRKDVDFVILRAGYGKDNTDARFEEHIKGLSEHNVHMGIYWFSYAKTTEDAENEGRYAALAYKKIPEHLQTLPIFFDYEYDSLKYANLTHLTPDAGDELYDAFCRGVFYVNPKVFTGIYTNLDFLRNTWTTRSWLQDMLWIADYSTPSLWEGITKDAAIKQIKSNYKAYYANGNLDLNVINPNRAGWKMESDHYWRYYSYGIPQKYGLHNLEGRTYCFDLRGRMMRQNADGSLVTQR